MAEFPLELITINTDVVVVGGGGAASRAALSARQEGADVRLLAKAPLRTGGSTVHGASEIMSMGAAGFGDRKDSAEIHYADTMRAGKGFIDPTLVQVLSEDAPARIRDLIKLGVQFDRLPAGSDEQSTDYKLIRSDFGSYGRAMGVQGRTGKAFVDAISEELLRTGVQVDAPVMLVDLVRDSDGAISGALAFDAERQRMIHYVAPAVVLGTGGMHGAFQQQVSTAEMSGDGQAICFRHGAELVNLEFHQFGPALVHPYIQLFSKSCFVLHPKITNSDGHTFLQDYVPPNIPVEEVLDEKVFPFTTSNPSRYLDIAIAREINSGRAGPHGGVFFSFAHVSENRIAVVIPNTARWMHERGLDVRTGQFEVGIAFQCMNGGVRMADTDAQSTIPGLYVIGELAGGVRGPDRPGGNSLAEGQVFGHRAGSAAARRAKVTRSNEPVTLAESLDSIASSLGDGHAPNLGELEGSIRTAMQRHCLVEKDAAGLQAARSDVATATDALADARFTPRSLLQGLSLRNMAQISGLVLDACLARAETRSGHYRTDHPDTDDAHFLGCFVWKRNGDAVDRGWKRF